MLRTGFAYGVVGAGTTVLYIILFGTLVEIAGVSPTISAAISFIPVFFSAYYLNYNIVFKSKEKHRKAIIKYLIVTSIGFLTNVSVVYIGSEIFGFWYVYSQVAAFVIVPLGNFVFNLVWTFGTDGLKEDERLID